MSRNSAQALYWMPRILTVAFIAFLSLFALDVFNEHLGIWQTVLALAIHLIPSLVLLLALVIAWRWEWFGAAFYAFAGLFYTYSVLRLRRPALHFRLGWIAVISGPAFAIALLFLANWLHRRDLRPAR